MRIFSNTADKSPNTAANSREAPHLRGLFLEGIQDAVDKLLLQLVVDVGGTQVTHDLLNSLHHHLPVLLSLVLQVIHNARDDFGCTNLICQFDRCVYQLWANVNLSD